MRVLACVLACAACRGEPAGPAKPTTHEQIVLLTAHAGATELFGDDRLLMSFARDWEKPGPLRLSRGRGAVERTLNGWPIGVAGERAYYSEPAGSELRIARAGITGEPEELARVAAPRSPYMMTAVVTGDGHVALAVPNGETSTKFEIVAPDKTVRELDLVRPTDAAGLIGDPRGSDVALSTSYTHGNREPGAPASAISLVDGQTGAVRWSQTFDHTFAANEGEAAFVDGGLAVHLGNQIVLFDRTTGARTVLVDNIWIDARNAAFAPAGDAVAYVHYVHPSDVMPISMEHACEVYVARRGQPAPLEPAKRFDGGCYFGMGVLFVGDALWLAPR